MSTKQVILWRKDLNVRTGKKMAQAAHASTAWLTRRVVSIVDQLASIKTGDAGALIRKQFTDNEWDWLNGSFTKITLQVEDENELHEKFRLAKEMGLEANLIVDSGKTEFNDIPTSTAVGIGPDESKRIDAITSKLKLY